MFPFADFRYWHASDRIGGGVLEKPTNIKARIGGPNGQ